jgi:DNA-binding LacI/PurR family transcriptional regulator
MARAAAELLIRSIDVREQGEQPQHIFVSPYLLIRQSVAHCTTRS